MYKLGTYYPKNLPNSLYSLHSISIIFELFHPTIFPLFSTISPTIFLPTLTPSPHLNLFLLTTLSLPTSLSISLHLSFTSHSQPTATLTPHLTTLSSCSLFPFSNKNLLTHSEYTVSLSLAPHFLCHSLSPHSHNSPHSHTTLSLPTL